MSFPQSVFVSKISGIIHDVSVKPTSIIDMPCGNGFTTIKLAENFPEINFTGIDINPGFLRARPRNVVFSLSDIHAFVDEQKSMEFVCLINSLYLLPHPIGLLEKVFLKLKHGGTLVLIVPNIDGDNFKNFQKLSPQTNQFTPTKEELTKLLRSIGYGVKLVEPVVFTHFYGRLDAKLLFPWRDAYLRFLERRNEKKGDRHGAYHLFHLRKS